MPRVQESGTRSGQSRPSLMPGTRTHTGVTSWPPTQRGGRVPRRRPKVRPATAALTSRHDGGLPSYTLAPHALVVPDRWTIRAASGSAAKSHGARRPSSAQPPLGASTGVPKSLGVVSCEGCGVRSHRGGAGAAMHCCAGCGNVRSCDTSCRILARVIRLHGPRVLTLRITRCLVHWSSL